MLTERRILMNATREMSTPQLTEFISVELKFFKKCGLLLGKWTNASKDVMRWNRWAMKRAKDYHNRFTNCPWKLSRNELRQFAIILLELRALADWIGNMSFLFSQINKTKDNPMVRMRLIVIRGLCFQNASLNDSKRIIETCDELMHIFVYHFKTISDLII